MNATRFATALFLVAAVYDAGLGAVFLTASAWVYDVAQVTPPNHWGYVQFPAALLVVFGLMFAAIAVKPLENRNMIPYGVLLKVAYCGLVFMYWYADGIPNLWKPFAIIDTVMGILFVWSYQQLGRQATGAMAARA
jgi:hypothetical protein